VDDARYALAVDAARLRFAAFVLFAGRDDEGRPVAWRPVDELVWSFVEEAIAEGADVCVMVPNGFGKSTQANWRIAFEIGRNPNLLAAVVTDSEENSALRVSAVRDLLKTAEYRQVFPGVRIAKGAGEGVGVLGGARGALAVRHGDGLRGADGDGDARLY